MSIKLIVLGDEPGRSVWDYDIRKTDLADESDKIVEDGSIIGWVLNALDWDGAEIGEEDGTRTVKFNKTFRERYFRHYWNEFQRWIKRAAEMDFEDYITHNGRMKFEDAEHWFKYPNGIYVWYSGYYCMLTEFLRNVSDDEKFYVVQAFDIE